MLVLPETLETLGTLAMLGTEISAAHPHHRHQTAALACIHSPWHHPRTRNPIAATIHLNLGSMVICVAAIPLHVVATGLTCLFHPKLQRCLVLIGGQSTRSALH